MGVVLITGAARGVGAAAAKAFAAEGASLALLDVSYDPLRELAEKLRGAGTDVLIAQADVSDDDAVAAAVAEATGRFEAFDVLIANAGICEPERPLTETSVATVDRLIGTNLIGVINTLRHGVPRILDGGAVVITSSVSGLISHPGAAVYAATKIGLIGLGRALALEVAPRRIRVNMVCPGGIDTGLTHGVYGESTPEVIEQYNAENPLGRIAQPEDIAGAMVFLSQATHITGVSLRVDGGDGLMGVL